MALINCPECGKEGVSDSAISCPNCGYNIKNHFEKINREIELKKAKELKEKKEQERIEREKERIEKIHKPINRFKAFSPIKKCICIIVIIAIIVGIVEVVKVTYSALHYQTFSSKESMINSVIGDYVDAEHFDKPYVFCSINENYVIRKDKIGTAFSTAHKIDKWDYEKGKLYYGGDSKFDVLRNGSIDSGVWIFSKKNYHKDLDIEVIDIKWNEENGKTKCIATINGEIKANLHKKILVESKAFIIDTNGKKQSEKQTKDLLTATSYNSTASKYTFTNSIVYFDFDETGVDSIYVSIDEEY